MLREPTGLLPDASVLIDERVVASTGRHVLVVWGVVIVVPIDSHNSDFGVLEHLVHDLGDVASAGDHFVVVGVPNGVVRVVASPHEDVGLHGVTDVLKHQAQSLHGHVAHVAAPLARLLREFRRVAI